MGLILDTNALSAIAEGEREAAHEFAEAQSVAIPVIVLGEYLYGIAQSRRKTEYERWLADVLSVSSLLDVNRDTAIHYAAIRGQLRKTGSPIPSNDLWIAALCLQHALPVLSRDRHFDSIHGLQRIAW
ncbi:MAG: type II toxin-antitoxin system VapC family toxin [Terriglobia bacterium]